MTPEPVQEQAMTIHVPIGWQLVPCTPTPEMIEAGANEAIRPFSTAGHKADAVWAAMLAASPKP